MSAEILCGNKKNLNIHWPILCKDFEGNLQLTEKRVPIPADRVPGACVVHKPT